MALTTVNIPMDSELKADMEAVCKELGMDMTTAFTIFAVKMAREHRISFEVSVDPFYGKENIAHLKEAIALRVGKSFITECWWKILPSVASLAVWGVHRFRMATRV